MINYEFLVAPIKGPPEKYFWRPSWVGWLFEIPILKNVSLRQLIALPGRVTMIFVSKVKRAEFLCRQEVKIDRVSVRCIDKEFKPGEVTDDEHVECSSQAQAFKQ